MEIEPTTKIAKSHVFKDIIANSYNSGVGYEGKALRDKYMAATKQPIFQVGARLALSKFSKVKEFYTLLHHYNADRVAVFAYVDGDEVVVYPNLKIGNLNLFRSTYGYHSYKLYLPYVEQFTTELADARKKVRWASVYKGFKYIRKKERMSMAKFLTRWQALGTAGWPDHQIRDIGQKIMDSFKPGRLVYCEAPDDYFKMFQVRAYSCMYNDPADKSNHHGESARKFWQELKAKNMFPSVWYHYNPHCKGVMFMRETTPEARCFILYDEAGNAYGHGYIHTSTASASEEMEKLLKKADHKRNTRGQIRITKNFKVPGVESSDGIVCPLPHCDDFVKPFYVRYDAALNEFEFSGNPGKGWTEIRSTYEHAGYIRVRNLQ